MPPSASTEAAGSIDAMPGGRQEPASAGASPLRTLGLAVRFSLREMRGGLAGFMVFVTCIALGVGAIGGVNSVANSITAGVAREGQSLLGGDLRFELSQRRANEAEHAFLKSLGGLAESAGLLPGEAEDLVPAGERHPTDDERKERSAEEEAPAEIGQQAVDGQADLRE